MIFSKMSEEVGEEKVEGEKAISVTGCPDSDVLKGGQHMEWPDVTLKGLQAYIREFDHRPEMKEKYFQKLIEEVGELAEAIRKDRRRERGGSIKGTIDEELYDVLYYVAALANLYEIDLENSFRLKEEINQKKYFRAKKGS
jgi:NTP pyrophosphatase (non-canonical NTP hydrolase)